MLYCSLTHLVHTPPVLVEVLIAPTYLLSRVAVAVAEPVAVAVLAGMSHFLPKHL
jgi:hypothetical protein